MPFTTQHKIDKWFLSKLKNIAEMRLAVKKCGNLDALVSENGADRIKS
jgi:carbamoyl-phosphate synthase/aspartate carbamoyltransferase